MIHQWTSGLKDPVEIERFQKIVRNSSIVLDRLHEMISDRERAISGIETGVEIYKQPGWDALLAHYNGERAALKYIKRIITLDPEVEHE